MKKRFLALALTLMMVISMVPIQVVYAGTPASPTITGGTVNANAGDTNVEIPVTISDCDPFCAMSLDIILSNGLTLTEIRPGTLPSGLSFTGVVAQSVVDFSDPSYTADYTIPDGVLFTLVVNVADNAPVGDLSVSVRPRNNIAGNISNSNLDDVTFTFVPGKVTVTPNETADLITVTGCADKEYYNPDNAEDFPHDYDETDPVCQDYVVANRNGTFTSLAEALSYNCERYWYYNNLYQGLGFVTDATITGTLLRDSAAQTISYGCMPYIDMDGHTIGTLNANGRDGANSKSAIASTRFINGTINTLNISTETNDINLKLGAGMTVNTVNADGNAVLTVDGAHVGSVDFTSTNSLGLTVVSGSIDSLTVGANTYVEIRGGTFGFDPTSYVDDLDVRKVVNNGDGTYTVCNISVFVVDGQDYGDFTSARGATNNAGSDKIIKLGEDYTPTVQFKTVSDEFTLDLNGHNVGPGSSATRPPFQAGNSGGTLTITNSSSTPVVITHTTNNTYGVFYLSKLPLTIDGANITIQYAGTGKLFTKYNNKDANKYDVIIKACTIDCPEENLGVDNLKSLTIMGGRFSFDPTAYVPDGYEVTQDINDDYYYVTKHVHEYTSQITTPATCTTDGERTYSCACGDSYTEPILATGHNYVDHVCADCDANEFDEHMKVYLSVASGNEVNALVTDDYNIEVTLPETDADGKAYVNSSSVSVEVVMQNVASLGINGLKSHSIEFDTGLGNNEVDLSEWLSNAYAFGGGTIYAIVDDMSCAYTFERTDNTISGTTDTEAARAAWQALASHVSTSTQSNDDSYIIVKNGSYILMGTEYLRFDDNFSGDLRLDNLSDLDSMDPIIRNAVVLDSCVDQEGKITLFLKAGTTIALGSTVATLDDDYIITIDCGEEIATISVKLDDLRKCSGKTEIVKKLITAFNDIIKVVDNTGVCVNMRTIEEETNIVDQVKADATVVVTQVEEETDIVTFDVKPYFVDGSDELVPMTDEELEEYIGHTGVIQFRLPVPASWTEDEVQVIHYLDPQDPTQTETCMAAVQGKDDDRYVVAATQTFSNFAISKEPLEVVAINIDTEISYTSIEDALFYAIDGETVQLLANNIVIRSDKYYLVKANTTLDLNGYLLSKVLGFTVNGQVIDTSVNAVGVVSSQSFAMSGSQIYTPVYDDGEDGYHFIKLRFSKYTGITGGQGTSLQFSFAKTANRALAYGYFEKDDTEYSGFAERLKARIYLTYPDQAGTGTTTLTFTYTDAIMEEVLNSALTSPAPGKPYTEKLFYAAFTNGLPTECTIRVGFSVLQNNGTEFADMWNLYGTTYKTTDGGSTWVALD